MKDVFILTKSKFGPEMVMTPDNVEDALIKIIRRLNRVRENGKVNVYVSFDDMDKNYMQELFTKIVDFLDLTSINDLNINFVIDKGYVDIQDSTVQYIHDMIDKYKLDDHIDIILNIVVTGEQIQQKQLDLVNLIKNISNKFIKIWAHIDASNIININNIMTQLLDNHLLDSSTITFDVDIYGSLTDSVKDAIRKIPIAALNKLLDMFLAETENWESRFIKECFNPDGELLSMCPNYKSCILVRKTHSKLQMIKVLSRIIYSLPIQKSTKKVSDVTKDYQRKRRDFEIATNLVKAR